MLKFRASRGHGCTYLLILGNVLTKKKKLEIMQAPSKQSLMGCSRTHISLGSLRANILLVLNYFEGPWSEPGNRKDYNNNARKLLRDMIVEKVPKT